MKIQSPSQILDGEIISPCASCWYCTLNDDDAKIGSPSWKCNHPVAREMINIPSVINKILEGYPMTPTEMRVQVENSVNKDLGFFWPMDYNIRDIIGCRSQQKATPIKLKVIYTLDQNPPNIISIELSGDKLLEETMREIINMISVEALPEAEYIIQKC